MGERLRIYTGVPMMVGAVPALRDLEYLLIDGKPVFTDDFDEDELSVERITEDDLNVPQSPSVLYGKPIYGASFTAGAALSHLPVGDFMPTTKEPTSAPTNKVTAATLSAAVGTAIYSALSQKFPVLAQPEIAMTAAPLVIAIVTFVPAWLKANLTPMSQAVHSNRNWTVLVGGVIGVVAGGAAVAFLL